MSEPVLCEAGPLPSLSAGASAPQANICLVYATLGRAEVLSQTFAAVARQTLRPSSVIVSCPLISDAGDLAGRPDVTLLLGPAGLACQRNRALAALPEATEIVAFFDDDFVPHPQWFEAVARIFQERPDVGAVTGHLIADGIKGPGITIDAALRMIEDGASGPAAWVQESYSPYGCNMAFRRAMIEDLWFDERLVLYGWLEDRDFGAALARRGAKLVKLGAALGVHMGSKRGRVSGVKLGYSQIVNPLYLRRKGTMRLHQVIDHVVRNMGSNLIKFAKPEPYIDRAGRLRGNIKGILDVLRGRLKPERAKLL